MIYRHPQSGQSPGKDPGRAGQAAARGQRPLLQHCRKERRARRRPPGRSHRRRLGAVGLTRAARSRPRHPRSPRTRHPRRSRTGRRPMLGRQGIPRGRRPGPHPVLGTMGNPFPRPEGREPIPCEDPRSRRASHGHAEALAPPPQTTVLHHPSHRPRPSHPRPASDQLRPMMEKAHCLCARRQRTSGSVEGRCSFA
jgi:hypothetical protein